MKASPAPSGETTSTSGALGLAARGAAHDARPRLPASRRRAARRGRRARGGRSAGRRPPVSRAASSRVRADQERAVAAARGSSATARSRSRQRLGRRFGSKRIGQAVVARGAPGPQRHLPLGLADERVGAEDERLASSSASSRKRAAGRHRRADRLAVDLEGRLALAVEGDERQRGRRSLHGRQPARCRTPSSPEPLPQPASPGVVADAAEQRGVGAGPRRPRRRRWRGRRRGGGRTRGRPRRVATGSRSQTRSTIASPRQRIVIGLAGWRRGKVEELTLARRRRPRLHPPRRRGGPARRLSCTAIRRTPREWLPFLERGRAGDRARPARLGPLRAAAALRLHDGRPRGLPRPLSSSELGVGEHNLVVPRLGLPGA